MTSTYSPSLRIELIETGTADEAWGQPTDNNLGTIIEQAITGVESVSLTGVSTYTLSASNAVADQSRNAVLVFTGTPTANCNVIAPSVNKVYIAKNSTSGGYNVNLKTASGNAVSIGANSSQLVYCNGTDFKGVSPNVIVGDMSVTGNVTVGGNVTINTSTIKNTAGNLTFTSTGNTVNFGYNTGALKPPVGGTAQRPATPKNGMSRWNTELNTYEIYNGTLWQAITLVYLSSYLIVAGGGGGGVGIGAGGGGGGILYGSLLLNTGNSYSIVVGGGGNPGVNGSNSSAFNLTAVGGGAGATGNAGGSGGGGGGSFGAGSGTTGQGYAGGPGASGPLGETYGGGGGGAGGAGQSAVYGTRGGDGGIGYQSAITGTSTYYAGGTGGTRQGIGGTGGTNGAGYLNYGGGGDSYNPGPGQNGVVIVSYANPAQIATGGTVTSYTSGGTTYWVHTFTSSGTFTVS